MPIQTVTVSLATCDVCGTIETKASPPGTPDADGYFERIGWSVYATSYIRGRLVSPSSLCPRCSLHVGVPLQVTT